MLICLKIWIQKIGYIQRILEQFFFVKNKHFYFPLLTSCCGYTKETKITYELEQILGKDVIDRIVFTKIRYEVIDILNELSMDAATLYITVEREIEKEVQ